MSCEYSVHCVDCGSTNELGANHGQELIRSLIRNAPAIAAFAPVARDISDGLALYTLYGSLDLSWFVEHGSHALRARDEYGRFDGDCPKQVSCGACGHLKWCRLPHSHAGACQP